MTSYSDSEFPELKIVLDKNDLIAEVSRLVQILRPNWVLANIHYKAFTNGLSNKLVGATHNDDIEQTILVRIYGENTEKIIDRNKEIETLKELQILGVGPKLYGVFSNGIAYQFLPGNILDVESCQAEEMYPLVAEKIAFFHSLIEKNAVQLCHFDKDNVLAPVLWKKIKNFLALIPSEICNAPNNENQEKRVVLPSLQELIKEAEWMEKSLQALNDKIVYCHNDLLLANIIFYEKNNSVNFIDFEYAGPNYRAYDIANHFCEFAGVDTFDPSRYPTESFRRSWISTYLKKFNQNEEVDENELNLLISNVEKFSLASHFFWGIWALIQAANSTIDFDFRGYSSLRLVEYYKKKADLKLGTAGN